MSNDDQEHMNGYLDGLDLSSPEPSENRTWCYRHSYSIGRREAQRKAPVPAAEARNRAALASQKDASA